MEKRKSFKDRIKSWFGPNTEDEGITASAVVMDIVESDHDLADTPDVPDMPDIQVDDTSGGILGVIGSLLDNVPDPD